MMLVDFSKSQRSGVAAAGGEQSFARMVPSHTYLAGSSVCLAGNSSGACAAAAADDAYSYVCACQDKPEVVLALPPRCSNPFFESKNELRLLPLPFALLYIDS